MFNFLGGQYGASFESHFRAMPVAFTDKQSAEYGDKVILPPSALDRLASLHIEYPMLFKLENISTKRFTHCGVLEFVAEEGVVYMPHWMMQNLLLQVGDTVKLNSVSIPKGTYVKLQPVTSDFLDISNPKAVLERSLRSYSCLTVGDCFVVNYNNKNYEIEVREARPAGAISIIETDCQVDFEAPKDYKEPEPVRPKPPPPKPIVPEAPPQSAPEPDADEGPKFQPFVGSGRRLDGKPATPSTQPASRPGSAAGPSSSAATSAGGDSRAAAQASSSGGVVPSKPGTVVSTGNRLLDKLQREKQESGKAVGQPTPAPIAAPAPPEEDKSASSSFKAFSGKGYSLK